MALESASFINGLVATNPVGSDAKSAGDDHIRLLKSTILATFPNITGAVTPTHTELNYVDGVTSAIQTQINAIGSPNRSFVSAATASSSASIAFADLDPAYDYELRMDAVRPATNGANLQVQVSTNNGSSYQTTSYFGNGILSTTTVETSSISGAAPVVAAGVSTASTGLDGVVRLTNLSVATNGAVISFDLSFYNSTTSANAKAVGSLYPQAAAAVDAVKVIFSAGNIASGTFQIYKIKRS